MKILLTAFTPFGGERVNPSSLVLEAVAEERLPGIELDRLVVPTVFVEAPRQLEERLLKAEFDAVLCLGQAGGRAALCPERVAINVDDARIPDNRGQQRVDEPVVPGGPAAYFSTLPVKAMVEAIRAVGLPARLSNSAGTFVCNHLMYALLHLCATTYPRCRAGFMHIPYLPEQVVERAETPAMSLDDIVRGVEAALLAIRDQQVDLTLPEGSLH